MHGLMVLGIVSAWITTVLMSAFRVGMVRFVLGKMMLPEEL